MYGATTGSGPAAQRERIARPATSVSKGAVLQASLRGERKQYLRQHAVVIAALYTNSVDEAGHLWICCKKIGRTRIHTQTHIHRQTHTRDLYHKSTQPYENFYVNNLLSIVESYRESAAG